MPEISNQTQIELLKRDLETAKNREDELAKKLKEQDERIDAIEKVLLKANVAAWVGLGMIGLMGAAMTWIITHIDAMQRVFGVAK